MHCSIIVSANAEWEIVRSMFPGVATELSPYGEYFFADVANRSALFFHGGWGKVAAAASTQYLIDRFVPPALINLGTCGGIEGRVNRFDIVAAERAVIYDIDEAMGDWHEGIAHYTTELDIPPGLPPSIIRTTIYSADRDLTPSHLRDMEKRHRALVVDWESGAVAWVAKRNRVPVLIIRGVTDLVSVDYGEGQGNLALFQENARRVMQSLIQALPDFLNAFLRA